MANMRARLTLLVPVLILFHHCIPLTGAFPLPVLSDKKYHQSRIPYVSPHAAVRLQDHVREYQLFRLDPECDRRCIGHVMALLNKTKCTDVTLLTTLKIVEARCDGYDDVSAHSIGKYVVRHEKRIRKQYDNVLLPPVSIGETIDDPGAIPEEEDSGLYTDSYSFNHSIERTLQYGNVIWNLDRIDQVSRSLDRKLDLSCFPRLGDGVFLYVLDSGCRTSHIEFKGRMKGIKVGRYTTFEDGHGHGTHVSGTAAGNSYGLCKKCTVFCVKTLDEDNRGSLTDVLNSIDWVIHHKQAHPAAPAVVVLSLGARAETDLLDLAMEDVLNAGIIPVVAAGNGKDDACAWTPARSESVITVAASTMHDLTRWSSNGGRCIDIAAPGQYIESASHISDFESRIMSGTSMAAPHVAGAVALILGENRHLDIKKLKKILALNSIPVFDEKRNRYYSLLQIKHDDCSVYHVEPQYQAGGYFVESEQISAPRLYEAPPPPAPSPFPTQTPTPSSTTQPSTTPSQTASPSVSPTPTPSPTPSQTASPSVSPTPTPSPTPSKTPSPSITPTPTPSPTPSKTPSPSITPTPTPSPTPSQTASPSVSPTPTPSPTPSKTPSPSITPTPTPSPTPSQTASPSVSPTPTPSPTPSKTPSPSITPTPTPSPTPSKTPSPSITPTPTPSPTPSQTASPSVSPTPTPSPTPSKTPSPSITPTPTPSPTPSQTASPSVSPTPTPSPTPSKTPSPSITPTRTPSFTPSKTPSPSITPTPTPSPTPSQTASPSVSPTPSSSPTPSQTASPSVSPTPTSSPTPSKTPSPSVSPTPTPSPTPSQTASPSVSPTPTPSPTPSQTASPSVSPTPTPSLTPSQTAAPSVSQTPTSSPTASPSVSPTPASSPTPSQTASPSVSPTTTSSPTPSQTASPSVSPTSTPSPTPSQTALPSVSPTPTPSPTPSQTASPSVSPTPTPSPTPSQTASPSVSPTPTPSPTPSQTASPSVFPTRTPPPTPSQTASPSVSPILSPSPVPLQTPSPSASATPTTSPTPSQAASPPVTASPSLSKTQKTAAEPETLALGASDYPHVSDFFLVSPVATDIVQPSSMLLPVETYESIIASLLPTISPSAEYVDALGASEESPWVSYLVPSPELQPSVLIVPSETYESILTSTLPTISPGV